MDFTFSPAEAQVLLGLLASVVVPFLVSLFSKPTTNKYVKLGLALVTSLVGGPPRFMVRWDGLEGCTRAAFQRRVDRFAGEWIGAGVS